MGKEGRTESCLFALCRAAAVGTRFSVGHVVAQVTTGLMLEIISLSNHVVSGALINLSDVLSADRLQIPSFPARKHVFPPRADQNRVNSVLLPTLHATLYVLNMGSVITIKMLKMVWFQVIPTL